MTVVVGSVPYLNEKPLTRWFRQTAAGRASGIEVIYEVPSKLAAMLATGEIDAALVSSFEYFRTPGYVIASGVSISGQDEILSVRAFSRLPWRSVQSVALDTSSLTSAALLRILLTQQFDANPAYISHSPDLSAMLDAADAALLIGDRGMQADATGLRVIDLGSAWRKLTGLPFVYAVWLGRPERLTPQIVTALNTARDWGVTQIEPIVAEEAERLGTSPKIVRRYLTDIMDYGLGTEHRAALVQFGERARQINLIADVPFAITIAEGDGL